MADISSMWDEAGQALGGLGLKLKLHYEQQRDSAGETGETADTGDVAVAPEDVQDKEAVESAVARLGTALQDAFEALGNASRDDAVKQDVTKVGRTISEALSVTFAEVSDDVRKAFESRKQT